MFNQLLACASCKDAPLTHVITIVVKALNVNLDNYTRFVEHSYFTKQAFVRGEIVDVVFHLIPPHFHSYWRGIQGPPPVEEQQHEEFEEDSTPKEELPQHTPFGDVPLITYPIQSTTGASSSAHPPIWDQILDMQIAMQRQLNEMEFQNHQLARRQCKIEYKLNQIFAHSGYPIESPPPTPTDH